MDFKVMLRNYLIEKGLTQEQFGEMVGVTGPAVNTWVLGKRKSPEREARGLRVVGIIYLLQIVVLILQP